MKDNTKNKGIIWLIKCVISEHLFVIKGDVNVLIYEFPIYFQFYLLTVWFLKVPVYDSSIMKS